MHRGIRVLFALFLASAIAAALPAHAGKVEVEGKVVSDGKVQVDGKVLVGGKVLTGVNALLNTDALSGVTGPKSAAPAALLNAVSHATVSLLAVLPSAEQTATSASAMIDGAEGGTLSLGRFTLTVPAGAWSGRATVTIHQPNPALLQCSLEVSGVENQFAVPVTLTTDLSYTGAAANEAGMVWFDPASAAWWLIESGANGSSISTNLSHFSQYGVLRTKAGW